MPFGVLSGVGQGMGVINGVLNGSGDRRRGRGSFWGDFGASHCNKRGLCCVVSRERRALPELLWDFLFTFIFCTKSPTAKLQALSYTVLSFIS